MSVEAASTVAVNTETDGGSAPRKIARVDTVAPSLTTHEKTDVWPSPPDTTHGGFPELSLDDIKDLDTLVDLPDLATDEVIDWDGLATSLHGMLETETSESVSAPS